MGHRSSYTPGTFCWADLTTPDQATAKRFYGELFGWDTTDNEAGEGVYYTTAAVSGQDVAAISPQPPQQRDAGVPPMWNSYVSVESADAALARARELGADVHADAFDVFDVGRMGVLQDPQGAFVLVWEPRSHIGASLVNAHGALTWNELATPDMEASVDFYGRLFEWTFDALEGMGVPYMTIKNREGATNGGIREAARSEPTYWLVYFGCNDLARTLERVSELGGTKVMGPMEIAVGQLAVAQDPTGAVFALFAGQLAQ